jgi:cyclomaltodextrinase / maltogenic alpha-amylase / neopullulanase
MQIHTPDWVKHAIFYQIFPDRFAKSQPLDGEFFHPHNLEEWEETPTFFGYKGGNLWGVIDRLDYLQDLGINAIYFTPIFQSAANHRYHTHDYYQVDPILGGNRAFEALLAEAHKREIKIVLDGVFNHASRGFFFFHDLLENGSQSPWVDWFKIEAWPLSPYDGDRPANYASWADIRALPQFNHDNPQVREYLMQVGEYWIKKGIDGWRLDVPFEIKTPGFWQEFRDRIKAINPEAYIVGEVWTDSREWLDGTQFDGVMNYLFTGPTIAFAAGDRVIMEYVQSPSYEPYPALSAKGYGEKIQELLALYPWEIQLTQLNLLASHDTARLMTIAGGDKSSVELATLLLLTFPGAASIYYGDEVGLPGGIDPDCRRGFPKEEDWEIDLLNCHKQLIALRHQHPALRTGSYEILFADDSVYIFARRLDAEEIVVAVNIDAAPASVQFEVTKLRSQPDRLLYGQGEVTWTVAEKFDRMELSLPPRKGCIVGDR